MIRGLEIVVSFMNGLYSIMVRGQRTLPISEASDIRWSASPKRARKMLRLPGEIVVRFVPPHAV